jgi:hypothetical protein
MYTLYYPNVKLNLEIGPSHSRSPNKILYPSVASAMHDTVQPDDVLIFLNVNNERHIQR